LCEPPTRAATAFAPRRAASGALSVHAAASAQEVLQTMLVHQLKSAVLTLLLLAVAGTGLLALAAPARSREGEPPGEPIAKEARQEPRPPQSKPDRQAARAAPTAPMTATRPPPP